MKTIECKTGSYASSWGLTDLYKENEQALREAIESGEDFETERFDSKKELLSAWYERKNGQLTVRVYAWMDDLWEEDAWSIYDDWVGHSDEVHSPLIEDALYECCGYDGEDIPPEFWDHLAESLYDVSTSTVDSEVLPGNATYEEVMAAVERLENLCMIELDETYQRVCDEVKDAYDYYIGKEN